MPDELPMPACISLPPAPDEGEECITETPYLLGLVCDGGQRKLAWVLAPEVQNDPPFAAVAGKAPCGGDCSKKVNMVLELAKQNWKPAEIERVLKAL